MAEIVRNPAEQSNPPDPQLPSAAVAIPVPASTVTVENNPPDPQVPAAAPPVVLGPAAPEVIERDPVTGSLIIRVFGVGQPIVNDEATTLGPDSAVPRPLPRAEISTPAVIEVDVTAPVLPGPGITGPVEGISPYGEQDSEFDPTLVRDPGQDEFENEQDNLRRAQERETAEFLENQQNRGEPQDVDSGTNPQVPQGIPFDDDGFLNPGFTLDGDGEPVFIGDDFIDPSLTASAEATRTAARQQATLDNARRQATIQSQRKQGNDTDWRVRLSLAPQANYLYKAPDVGGQPASGILAPLAVTDGVIFPYTPRITTAYAARYSNYDLTHSNYRGYFYQGSHIDDILIEATFTAQDTAEAEYMLAVIHFFRSVTKMFYGQDPQRGTPPPLVYLRGLGEFQYNLHACVVSQFNYNLPNDVDYIRARSKNTVSGSLLQRRDRKSLPTNIFSSALARLSAAGITKGAQPAPPPVTSLGTAESTYVPTKLDMSITLKPMQSREQVSRQFSLRQYANGDGLKGGFW